MNKIAIRCIALKVLLLLVKTSQSAHFEIEDETATQNFISTILADWIQSYGVDLMIYNENYKHFTRIRTFLNFPITRLNVDKPHISNNSAIKYYHNYVMFSNCQRVYHMLEMLENSYLWNHESSVRGKYLLFLFECNTNMSEIFQIFWKRNIMNIVACALDTNNSWFTATYQPFSEESKCGQTIVPKLIKNFKSFTFATYPIYLKHCMLNVSVANQALPEAYYNKVPGLISSPLLLLAEQYELNVTFFNMSIDYQVGAYGNKLVIILNEVNDRKYDVVLASIARQMNIIISQTHLAEFSDIALFEEHVWYIPRTKKISPVMLLLIILPQDILLLILLTTAIAFLFWYIVGVLKKEEIRIIEMLGIMFGFSINLPKAKIFSFMFVFYVLYGQHIGYFFQANLSSKLTVPQYEKRLKTVEDVLNSNLIIMLHMTDKELTGSSEKPIIQKLHEKSIYYVGYEKKTNAVMNNQSLAYTAFLSSLITSYTLNHLNYVEILHDYDVMAMLEVQYLVGSGHPLLPTINSIVSKVTEHGFMVKWFKIDALDYKITESNQVVITINHLQSIFVALFIGLSGALVVFVIELSIYNFRKRYN